MRRLITLIIMCVSIIMVTATMASTPSPPPSVKPSKAWDIGDSKQFAMTALNKWKRQQWACLVKLWYNESRWNPKSVNKKKVSGKHAGGIPQVLGMSPELHPTRQIEQGLSYIYNRYGTPCSAWSHEKRKGWY